MSRQKHWPDDCRDPSPVWVWNDHPQWRHCSWIFAWTAHRGSKHKVISWKVKTVQLTSSYLTMISILFSFVTWKIVHFFLCLVQKAITTWHLCFFSLEGLIWNSWHEDYHPTKNRVWEPSEHPGSATVVAMAGNSLGPSVMEAEDSRPLDIMDPLVAEDFQVSRFLGCWMDGCFFVFFKCWMDMFLRDVWRMSFDVMWKYSDKVFIIIFLFRFSGRGPHGWGQMRDCQKRSENWFDASWLRIALLKWFHIIG